MQVRTALGLTLLAAFAAQLLAVPAHLALHHHDAAHHRPAHEHAGPSGAPLDGLHAHAHDDEHGHRPHSALDHRVTALTPSAPGGSPLPAGSALAPSDEVATLDATHVVERAPDGRTRLHRSTGPPHPLGARAPPSC